MLNGIKDYMSRALFAPALLVVASMLAAPIVFAQESDREQDAKTEIVQIKAVSTDEATTATLQPKWTDYKGITIGMSADEVRAKLDNLKDEGKLQDFFVFSDKESAQVFYDNERKVKAIAVNYINDSDAPDTRAVFGEQVEAETDGSIYKLVRYTDEGYWVAYNRTAGDAPLITVTIQKM